MLRCDIAERYYAAADMLLRYAADDAVMRTRCCFRGQRMLARGTYDDVSYALAAMLLMRVTRLRYAITLQALLRCYAACRHCHDADDAPLPPLALFRHDIAALRWRAPYAADCLLMPDV